MMTSRGWSKAWLKTFGSKELSLGKKAAVFQKWKFYPRYNQPIGLSEAISLMLRDGGLSGQAAALFRWKHAAVQCGNYCCWDTFSVHLHHCVQLPF